MSRQIKEKGRKAPAPAASAAPRELARRAARESMERLRAQARSEPEQQEPEDYGGRQIEGGAQRGAALAEHGVQRAVKPLLRGTRELTRSGKNAGERRETTNTKADGHRGNSSPDRKETSVIKERAAETEGRIREKPAQSGRVGEANARPVKERGQRSRPLGQGQPALRDIAQSLSQFDEKEIVEQPAQRQIERQSAVWETQSPSTMRGMSYGTETEARARPIALQREVYSTNKQNAHLPLPPDARDMRSGGGGVSDVRLAPTPDRVSRIVDHAAGSQPPHGKEAAAQSRVIVKEKKTAIRTGIKTRRTAAVERGKQLAIQNARRGGRTIRATGTGARRTAKDGAKAVRQLWKIIRDAAAALRAMLAALTGGGGVAVLVILVICLVAMLLATPFGLFLSGGSSESGDSLQSAITSLNGEFCMVIEQIQTDHPHDVLELDNDELAAAMDNWNDVLAVYAVLVTTDDASPGDAATMTPEKLDVLRRVFWDMNQISYTLTTAEAPDDTTTLTISITTKHQDEITAQYGFTAEQTALLHEMAQPQYANLFAAVRGSNASLTLSPRQMREIIDNLPPNLSAERRQVVLTAYQLLGKVNYHWGGKSLALGWDSRWGAPKVVAAAGDSTSGTMRPFGLDCSGFVDWVFYNVSNGAYVIGHGGGASAQHSYCIPISWSEAQPGDLAFYPGDSHVGVICGFDEDGNVRIIHCAKSANNVVVTGKSGFVAAGRPYYYTQ